MSHMFSPKGRLDLSLFVSALQTHSCTIHRLSCWSNSSASSTHTQARNRRQRQTVFFSHHHAVRLCAMTRLTAVATKQTAMAITTTVMQPREMAGEKPTLCQAALLRQDWKRLQSTRSPARLIRYVRWLMVLVCGAAGKWCMVPVYGAAGKWLMTLV